MRRGVLLALAILLVAEGLLASRVWRSNQEPTVATTRFISGPAATTLTAESERSVQLALTALADRSLEPHTRFASYQERMADARALLVRSLNANPAQAGALAKLASIDFELAAGDPEGVSTTLKRIELAATLAPRVPRVQAQIGELLLRMGRIAEGRVYLGEAARLDGGFSERVAEMLSSIGEPAEAIRELLPGDANSLAVLRDTLTTPEELAQYLGWVEQGVAEGVPPSVILIRRYAHAAREIRSYARIERTLSGWGPFDDAEIEAARLLELARTLRVEGRVEAALELATSAVSLTPESYSNAIQLGDMASAAGDYPQTIAAYNKALGILARRRAKPQARAFVYRRMGEAHEKHGRPALAFDSYRRSLELRPNDEFVQQRIRILVVGSSD